ncbi:uncharacterized protein BXZ73DRAFT_79235 [Epithele typhae]|uniref:uncharacterized protein n=1 Tax=Epithele typhae TaxID=378194 RepID=UPI002007B2D9|nr:uncharacterized protein BXZ73DRAFT_79235 [Epithele typhae]KAH9924695.1 hypothetical protein BXZ73DRAFT_79235 [Epithele typhae]
MDGQRRAADNLSWLALFAQQRRLAGQAPPRGEPRNLLDLLLNPDFHPHDFIPTDAAHNHDLDAYADMPPLNDDDDDDTPSGSPSRSGSPSPSSADTNDEDGDLPPPLEADDSPIPASFFSNTTRQQSPVTEPLDASAPRPDVEGGRAPSSPRTTVQRSGSRPSATDDGHDSDAESTSSLPTLQSISDSEDEDEEDVEDDDGSMPSMATVSDSDEWEDEEGGDWSDGEGDDSEGITWQEMFLPPTDGFQPLCEQELALRRRRRAFLQLASAVGEGKGGFFDVTEFTSRLTAFDEDPERAKVASEELVKRYEVLRTDDGEPADGCAICREGLLEVSADEHKAQAVLQNRLGAPVPHVPEAGPSRPVSRSGRTWKPPKVETLLEWVQGEEQARAKGVPRERPSVTMPEFTDEQQTCRPLRQFTHSLSLIPTAMWGFFPQHPLLSCDRTPIPLSPSRNILLG